jgi:hypothetical protein
MYTQKVWKKDIQERNDPHFCPSMFTFLEKKTRPCYIHVILVSSCSLEVRSRRISDSSSPSRRKNPATFLTPVSPLSIFSLFSVSFIHYFFLYESTRSIRSFLPFLLLFILWMSKSLYKRRLN